MPCGVHYVTLTLSELRMECSKIAMAIRQSPAMPKTGRPWLSSKRPRRKKSTNLVALWQAGRLAGLVPRFELCLIGAWIQLYLIGVGQ